MFGGDVVNRTRVPRVSTCGFTPGLTTIIPSWNTLIHHLVNSIKVGELQPQTIGILTTPLLGKRIETTKMLYYWSKPNPSRGDKMPVSGLEPDVCPRSYLATPPT